MKHVALYCRAGAIAALVAMCLVGCGGGGGGVSSWMDPSTPPTLQVSSSATLIHGSSFVGGPVSITLRIVGTDQISSAQALITPAGGETDMMPMSERSSGTFVTIYNAPPNLGNSGVDKQYTVIVSAIAAGTAVSSMCKFTVPSAGAPPPLPQ